jgi:type VI secretion system protein ImpE
MPAELIQRLEFEPPERPRDLLFRPARFTAHDGTEGTVFMPVLYYGSAAAAEAGLKLGRATEWLGQEGEPVRGLGQRLWLAGDNDVAMLDVRRLEFAPPAPGSAAP